VLPWNWLLAGSFWLTSLLFVVVVLGAVMRLNGLRLLPFLRYVKEELLIVLGTSSTEPVLPRMMSTLEHAGAAKPVVGITLPAGYSFNLDGTATYLTMGGVFLAQALGIHLSFTLTIAASVSSGRPADSRGVRPVIFVPVASSEKAIEIVSTATATGATALFGLTVMTGIPLVTLETVVKEAANTDTRVRGLEGIHLRHDRVFDVLGRIVSQHPHGAVLGEVPRPRNRPGTSSRVQAPSPRGLRDARRHAEAVYGEDGGVRRAPATARSRRLRQLVGREPLPLGVRRQKTITERMTSPPSNAAMAVLASDPDSLRVHQTEVELAGLGQTHQARNVPAQLGGAVEPFCRRTAFIATPLL
jgi:hypothetical protein